MALPVTISDIRLGDQNSYHGPFKSSGSNFYTVAQDGGSDGTLRAYKATDPTSSFPQVDTSTNSPTVNSVIPSFWVFQDGDNLHAIVVEKSGAVSVQYARFDMSSDTWVDVDTGVEIVTIEITGNTQTAHAVTIAVRSDGDIPVAYQGDSDMVMGTEYERIDWNVSTDSGVTWAGPVSIDNGGRVNWTGCVIVPGSSDRMHVFFKDDTANDVFQRTIRSDDSLETFPSLFDANVTTENYIFGPGVSYDDGGTQRVRCPYRNTTPKVSIAKLDSADTPTLTTDADVSDNTVRSTNSSVTVALAVDVKDLQLLYANNADLDLYRDTNDDDAGWGTDTEELDGITCNSISPRVYDRSGTQRLAFVYDDGGTVKYNEIDLAAVTVSVIHLTLAPYISA